MSEQPPPNDPGQYSPAPNPATSGFMLHHLGQEYGPYGYEQLRQMAAMMIPLGRAATPEEAAGGVFFLCSPWSNYVHGQVLNVTGGQFTGMTT